MTDSPTMPTSGETCGTCAAPLAADQRYCLNCGTRRGEPRLDPLAHLMPTVARPATPPPVAPTRSRGLLGTPGLPILGALAVLAALGVGVLIGSSGEDSPVISQRPPVVNITSAAGGPVAEETAEAAADAGRASATNKNRDTNKDKDEDTAAERKAAAEKAEDEIKKAGGSVLSKAELEASKNLTTEEARKRSAKLPSVVGTGGAPPAKDNKKAGAGTDAEVIK